MFWSKEFFYLSSMEHTLSRYGRGQGSHGAEQPTDEPSTNVLSDTCFDADERVLIGTYSMLFLSRYAPICAL